MKTLRSLAVSLIVCSSAHICTAQTVDGNTATVKLALPPGIVLPSTGTVFAIDTTKQGPTLVRLHATEVVTNTHSAENLVRSQILMGQRNSVELAGINASITLEDTRPTLYVRLAGEDPDLLRNRVHLIRLNQTSKRRVVTSNQQYIIGTPHAKKFGDVPINKADLEPNVWLQVTPQAPLEPGEYGIVFMPKATGLSPDAVYDFDTKAVK